MAGETDMMCKKCLFEYNKRPYRVGARWGYPRYLFKRSLSRGLSNDVLLVVSHGKKRRERTKTQDIKQVMEHNYSHQKSITAYQHNFELLVPALISTPLLISKVASLPMSHDNLLQDLLEILRG